MKNVKGWVTFVGSCLFLAQLPVVAEPMNQVAVCGVTLGKSLPEAMAKLGPPSSIKRGEANVVCPAGWDFTWPNCEARLVADYSGLHVVSISGQSLESAGLEIRKNSNDKEIVGFVDSIPVSQHVVDPAMAWKEIHRCYGLFEGVEGSVSWASLEIFVNKDGFAKAILTQRGSLDSGIPWPNLAEYQLRDPHVLDIPGF